MTPAKLPDPFSAPTDASVFRVFDTDARAVLKSVDKVAGTPVIHLADVVCVPGAGGRTLLGSATFDLSPAGLSHAVLRLPSGTRLIGASVCGLPARRTGVGDQRWSIELASRQLPHRIAVLYQGDELDGTGALGSDAVGLDAPTLEGIAVEKTLWTIYRDEAERLDVDGNSARSISAAEAQRQRLESSVRLLDAADSQPQDQIVAWYGRWERRISEAFSAYAAYSSTPRASSEESVKTLRARQAEFTKRHGFAPVTYLLCEVADRSTAASFARRSRSVLEPLDARLVSQSGRRILLEIPAAQASSSADAVSQHLGNSLVVMVRVSHADFPSETGALFDWAFAAQPADHYLIEGSDESLNLRIRDTSPDNAPWRVALALVVASVAAALVLLIRHGVFADVWVRWPQAACVVVGIVWLWILSPAWIGGCIIAAAAASAVLAGRRASGGKNVVAATAPGR
jgi:hypothetical protein